MNFSFPDFWWGYPGAGPSQPAFTILSLLRGHLLSADMAALLWGLLSRRASFLVVGGHYSGAGKTTTLSALAGFFPADTQLAFTRGSTEDFSFLRETDPGHTYVMVNEFSNHTPWYLWGQKAHRVFNLTEQEYAFAGTLHAESIEEVVSTLMTPQVSLTAAEIVKSLQLVVMQAAYQAEGGIERRVLSMYWLQPAARGPGGLGIKSLGVWDQPQDRWYLFTSPETWAELAAWAHEEAGAFKDEVAQRKRYLEGLLVAPEKDYAAVREDLLRFGSK